MSEPSNQPAKKNLLGRWQIALLVLAAMVIALAIGVPVLRERVRIREEKQKAEWRHKWFMQVKNGDDTAMVMDPLLLPMLANDAECVERLRTLNLDMLELSEKDAQVVGQFKNVESLVFYSCTGADHILKQARELPIKTVSLETSPVSKETLKNFALFPQLEQITVNMTLSSEEVRILESLPESINVIDPYDDSWSAEDGSPDSSTSEENASGR